MAESAQLGGLRQSNGREAEDWSVPVYGADCSSCTGC